MVVAGEELQAAIVGQSVYFSFPFGLPHNLNARAFQMAFEYGYEAVCSAYGDYNFPGDDPFHIRRIHVDDMVAAEQLGHDRSASASGRSIRSITIAQPQESAQTCGPVANTNGDIRCRPSSIIRR